MKFPLSASLRSIAASARHFASVILNEAFELLSSRPRRLLRRAEGSLRFDSIAARRDPSASLRSGRDDRSRRGSLGMTGRKLSRFLTATILLIGCFLYAAPVLATPPTTPAPTTPATTGACAFSCTPAAARDCTMGPTAAETCATACRDSCPRLVNNSVCSDKFTPVCVPDATGGRAHCAFDCIPQVSVACAAGTQDGAVTCNNRCEATCLPPGGAPAGTTSATCSRRPAPACNAPTVAASNDAAVAAIEATASSGSNESGAAGPGIPLLNPITGATTIPEAIGKIVKVVIGIAGAAALLMFSIGGAMWILSFGEEKRAKAARELIKNSTIGLLLIFFSYTIVHAGVLVIAEMGAGGGEGEITQADQLAPCVRTAIAQTTITQEDALRRTTASWACRRVSTNQEITDSCVRRGCMAANQSNQYCCAPVGASTGASTQVATCVREAMRTDTDITEEMARTRTDWSCISLAETTPTPGPARTCVSHPTTSPGCPTGQVCCAPAAGTGAVTAGSCTGDCHGAPLATRELAIQACAAFQDYVSADATNQDILLGCPAAPGTCSGATPSIDAVISHNSQLASRSAHDRCLTCIVDHIETIRTAPGRLNGLNRGCMPAALSLYHGTTGPCSDACVAGSGGETCDVTRINSSDNHCTTCTNYFLQHLSVLPAGHQSVCDIIDRCMTTGYDNTRTRVTDKCCATGQWWNPTSGACQTARPR